MYFATGYYFDMSRDFRQRRSFQRSEYFVFRKKPLLFSYVTRRKKLPVRMKISGKIANEMTILRP